MPTVRYQASVSVKLTVPQDDDAGLGRATLRLPLLRWGLVAAIFATCGYFLDLGSVIAVIGRISVNWLLLIFALMTVDRILMAWKWNLLLRALGVQLSFGRLVRIYYQGTLAGTFLPSGIGGDLLRTHWVSKQTRAPHRVYASLIMEKMIGLLSAASWGLVGLGVFWSQGSESSPVWIATVLASVLALNMFFFLSLRPQLHDIVLRWLERVPHFRLTEFLKRLHSAYRQYGEQRGALAWNGFLTVIEHALQLLVALAMATSLGLIQSVVPFIAVTAVYLLIYRLPISPDGWGLGEVASIALYGLIGIPPESAFGLALFAHIMQVLVVLPGIWFFCWPATTGRQIYLTIDSK